MDTQQAALVAGIDSSTQSVKVVVREAATGALVRHGQAAHPEGTQVDPRAWWDALCLASERAGGLADVAALAVGGQQHGLVALDENGEPVRPAMLWNDTASAPQAAALVAEKGAEFWARETGTVPVASITATKLRWLAENEPGSAARIAAICLPHDYLTWRLRGTGDLADLTTDASDASGTGYFDARTRTWRRDLLELALGHSDVILPRVAGPHEAVGTAAALAPGATLAPGMGDNAGAALALGLGPGDVLCSVGTSCVVSAVVTAPTADATGVVSGFSDATGNYLPLACTLNGSQVIDATGALLGADHAEMARLALAAPAGSDGLSLVPYLNGERTPNLPRASGALHGLTMASWTRENLARATFEGIACSLAAGVDALCAVGLEVASVRLVGGAARSAALREVLPAVLGREVIVPAPGEYVANGAARQAAWVLDTMDDDAAPLPAWPALAVGESVARAEATPHVRARYEDAAQRYLERDASTPPGDASTPRRP